ncbi:hypothetical protein LY90DRAFT_513526 [Neocallimastix californiae]|uniref:Uncharacterized protein n=1 Tax=Neocallimastix californiae TaxID=1754190 RepID=A0A1Y2AXX4_9FUNG|nr:hypothetical protein LY90DRAFT_513526 [Neocallimastix californiae]|eukprot:ORY27140.1 hypothetical protein LY90DRAFT_513526 [Neocallimastix californiae]
MTSDFKTREGEEFTSCDYQYICNKKNDYCIQMFDPSGVSAYTASSINNVYGYYYNNTFFPNARDCFSNNCVNGVCITNKENPVYICRPVKENSEIKVKCLLVLEEKCNENKDCADNASCTKENVCVIEYEPEEYSEKQSTLPYFIVGGIIIFAVIILLLIFLDKHKNNNKN